MLFFLAFFTVHVVVKVGACKLVSSGTCCSGVKDQDCRDGVHPATAARARLWAAKEDEPDAASLAPH